MTRRDNLDRFGRFRVLRAADPEEPEDWDAWWESRRSAIREAEIEAANRTAPDVRVTCMPKTRCARDGGRGGQFLAEVHLTKLGALWRSEILVAHDALPGFQQIYGEQAIVMRHPDTGGAAEVTRAAFDAVWRHKGWLEAPRSALTAEQTWRPQRAIQVRDLVDRDDLPHVTLRVYCDRHGQPQLPVDPDLLRAELPQHRTGTPRVVPLSALCRVRQ